MLVSSFLNGYRLWLFTGTQVRRASEGTYEVGVIRPQSRRIEEHYEFCSPARVERIAAATRARKTAPYERPHRRVPFISHPDERLAGTLGAPSGAPPESGRNLQLTSFALDPARNRLTGPFGFSPIRRIAGNRLHPLVSGNRHPYRAPAGRSCPRHARPDHHPGHPLLQSCSLFEVPYSVGVLPPFPLAYRLCVLP
jgi:hypothetical protein